MAITSKYYVINPTSGTTSDYLDFDLSYGGGSISTVGANIVYNGTNSVDGIYVRPGMTYDLTNTSGSVDKIYFGGNLSEYAKTFESGNMVLQRTVNSTQLEKVTLDGGTSLNSDSLIFHDGKVSANTLYTSGATLPTLDTSETSISPVVPSPLNATIQAWSTNAAGVGQKGETFAATKPGISLIVNGGNGVDMVYVADGEVVDATSLGQSVDKVFFRGTWESYTKTALANGNLEFSRLINGAQEKVTVTGGNGFSFDQLIFANGSVTTYNAQLAIQSNANGLINAVTDKDLTTKTPLISDSVIAASLSTLQSAAGSNTATLPTPLADTVYKNANAQNVVTANVAAYNSALDSTAIGAPQVTTTADVQKIVDAYNAIIASADNNATPNTGTPITAAQFTDVGVNNLPTSGTALTLLDNVVDVSQSTAVDSTLELQNMVNAAIDIAAAVGQGLSTTVTQADLVALGIQNVLPSNIAAIQAAIGTGTTANVSTKAALQALVDSATSPTNMNAALAALKTAAANNTASSPVALTALDYAKAGISGVDASNVATINSALDSTVVGSAQLNTEALAQGIVDAYKAILTAADGPTGTTSTPLTGDVYTLIGVTGLPASGAPAAGSALSLLDSAIDVKASTEVNTEPKVQALADAANHVMTAAGLPNGTSNPLTGTDLAALGVTGLTANNTQAVINAIVAQTSDANVDTLAKLQAVALAAENSAATALSKIVAAADANNAVSSSLAASVYSDAGVSGVTDANHLLAANSALDSGITGSQVNTVANVQALVNAYNAILNLADGNANTATPVLTGDQYAAVGITGVSGASAPAQGSTLYLLDSVVDAKAITEVNTVPLLQGIETAATHIIAAANGGTLSVTAADLTALGINGNFTDATTLTGINTAIHAAALTGVDTKGELQTIADLAAHATLTSSLNNVSNLDVTSNLVLTSSSAVTLGTTGMIHIHETGGNGYNGAITTGSHDVDIDLSTAAGRSLVTIDTTGTKITINPTWDLDLGANYTLNIDAGAFLGAAGNHNASVAVSGVGFSTVTPGAHGVGHTVAQDAVASQIMQADGTMAASKLWASIQDIGNINSTMADLGSLSGGAYALVVKNYATVAGGTASTGDGVALHDTNVSVTNFGSNDVLYIDNQANNAATQSIDLRYSSILTGGGNHGGTADQTILSFGTTSNQSYGTSAIALGFENNSTNQVFHAIYDVGATQGFATFLHSQPVIAG